MNQIPHTPYKSYAEFVHRAGECQNAYIDLIDTTLQSIFFSQYFSCHVYTPFDKLCESNSIDGTELDAKGALIVNEFLKGADLQHSMCVARTFTDIIGTAVRIYMNSITPECNLSYAKMRQVLGDEFIYHFSNSSCLLFCNHTDIEGYSKCVFNYNFTPAHPISGGLTRPPVPRRVWLEHILAVAMAGHSRLGAGSRVALLDMDTLNVVLQEL